MVADQSLCKIFFFRNTISHCAHHNEHGGEKSMANNNDSNFPTNANKVRKQNQQSEMQKANASTNAGNAGRTEFGAEFGSQTDVGQVQKQNQQSANRNQNKSK